MIKKISAIILLVTLMLSSAITFADSTVPGPHSADTTTVVEEME